MRHHHHTHPSKPKNGLSGSPKFISGLLLGICLLMLVGCGAANLNSSVNAAQSFSMTSGNWSFNASSSTNTNASQFLLGGHLEQTGTTVTGILHIASSRCFKVDQDIPVSGTVTEQSVDLTSLPIHGQRLHAALIGHGTAMVGNYSFSGGCSNGDDGSLNGNLVPAVSGIWNAIETQPDKAVTGVNLAVAQSANANPHGVYPLSGTFAFTASQCAVSARIASGWVAGNIVVINAETQEATGDSGSLRMEGDFASGHSPAIVGVYTFNAGTCKDKAGVLTFTP
ncbi:MAG TPA: hypothetical protein VGL89_19130 [Candidatus Koribacter sp.]|jgi:hypothetical protein